jgi:protein SCO1/2
MSAHGLGRRALLFRTGAGVALAGTAGFAPAARADMGWHNFDVAGQSPSLRFTMVRATDGRQVTQTAFRGDVVLLYFGYTSCPDICPTTMANLGRVLDLLGKQAAHVRVLFVTVDPQIDTLPMLKAYTKEFGPQMVGLRGTPDELAALARRFRVAYSVTPAHGTVLRAVTHSSAIYAFDESGRARLLIPSMASQTPDIKGTAADLRRLVAGEAPGGLMSRAWHDLFGQS